MNCFNCGKNLPEDSEFCVYCGKPVEIVQVPQCLRCGKSLPNDSEFCPYCGATTTVPVESQSKEEDARPLPKKKGQKWMCVALITLSVLVVGVSTLSVYQYINNQNLQQEILELEEKIDYKDTQISKQRDRANNLLNQVNENRELVDFVDTFVVFVEDDGTNLYHKYGCYRFKGNYFWAFNVDAARQQGYFACPNCCY